MSLFTSEWSELAKEKGASLTMEKIRRETRGKVAFFEKKKKKKYTQTERVYIFY